VKGGIQAEVTIIKAFSSPLISLDLSQEVDDIRKKNCELRERVSRCTPLFHQESISARSAPARRKDSKKRGSCPGRHPTPRMKDSWKRCVVERETRVHRQLAASGAESPFDSWLWKSEGEASSEFKSPPERFVQSKLRAGNLKFGAPARKKGCFVVLQV